MHLRESATTRKKNTAIDWVEHTPTIEDRWVRRTAEEANNRPVCVCVYTYIYIYICIYTKLYRSDLRSEQIGNVCTLSRSDLRSEQIGNVCTLTSSIWRTLSIWTYSPHMFESIWLTSVWILSTEVCIDLALSLSPDVPRVQSHVPCVGCDVGSHVLALPTTSKSMTGRSF